LDNRQVKTKIAAAIATDFNHLVAKLCNNRIQTDIVDRSSNIWGI
jgi:hypothetical protein